MLRRFVIGLLTLLSCVSPVLAEGLLSFEEYTANLSVMTDAEWTEEGPIRILAVEDGTTISVCLEGAEVVAVTVETLQDGDLADIGCMALEATGRLSEEALPALSEIQEDGSAFLDGCAVYHLVGKTRECYAICDEEAAAELVWQPTHGGRRLHFNPNCSGMDVARLVTPETAEALGFTPCARCAADGRP